MAQSDWNAMGNELAAAMVARGVSQGFTPPNGGGSFVYGWKTLQATTGVAGLTAGDSNFAPTAKGVRISAAIQRNGNMGGTVMLCAGLDANDVGGDGYLLGFTHDEEPSHLVLQKGSPSNGLLETPTSNVELCKSSQTFAAGTWAHLQFDLIIQPHGDVHLQLKSSDLGSHTVGSPSWEAIDGMPEYIDDALGVQSGSVPFNGGGYVGFAYYSESIGRYALIDHVKVARQL